MKYWLVAILICTGLHVNTQAQQPQRQNSHIPLIVWQIAWSKVSFQSQALAYVKGITMWPYSKIKDVEPEIKQAKCPICTGPTTAEHYPDGTTFTRTCPACQTPENKTSKKE